MKKINILLVDDEEKIAETIIAYLKKEDIICYYAENGEKGLKIFEKEKIDLCIFDWMLPGISGPEIIKKVRDKSAVPIIMLTARDDQSDIVIGLDMGADDYITKPFGPRELVARIKSLLRRSTKNNFIESTEIKYGNLKFNFEKQEIYKDNKLVQLTKYEFLLLEELYKNIGKVLSREYLMENVLGYRDFLYDRTLDTHIKNLRKKLEKDPKNPQYFITIRSIGFKMKE